jgi:hypothetical protein
MKVLSNGLPLAALLFFAGTEPALAARNDAGADTTARGGSAPAYFERMSTFVVCENTSCNRDEVEATSSEIITVSNDGLTLVYSDSPNGSIGFIDIADPANPKKIGAIQTDGEPTSVAAHGPWLLAGVNTSESKDNPSGYLAVYPMGTCATNLAACTPVAKIDLSGQPDSVAISPDGQYAAVVIENERDEDVTVDGVEGGLPQAPAGLLQVIALSDVPTSWAPYSVDLSGLSAYAPTDPEPEFVSINERNIAAVTLQENNHIVLVDLPTGTVMRDFAAGTVNLVNVDTDDDSLLDPVGTLSGLPREPDAITWLPDGRLATANEGDLFGGSRGFTIWGARGVPLFDSGVGMEYLALSHGHYPDGRADNKGVEPEGVTFGEFGTHRFMFVGSERANFVAVYALKGVANPEFVQLLPTGIGPEGLLAIPSRGLFVAASEDDEDLRSTVSIFKLQSALPSYPTIVSNTRTTGALAGIAPIGWVALSALSADRWDANKLYTAHDSFLQQSRLYTIDASAKPARIVSETVLHKSGVTVNYDIEGLTQAADGSFWVVSEGSSSGTSGNPNLLIKVAADGTVVSEIFLPGNVASLKKSNGYEGVTVTGSGQTEQVYIAFQREWTNDPAGKVRIGRYTPSTQSWAFFYYPLDAVESPAGGWVGLSEITALDDNTLLILERDNQAGPDARVKRLYKVSIQGITPQAQGGQFPLLTKTLARDLTIDLAAPKGWLQEKVEGVGVAIDGDVFIVTDNDGVDGNTGETQFINIGTRSSLGF